MTTVLRHGLALGLLVFTLFKLWLVHTEEIYGSATEHDALWFLNAAKRWYWGSDYSWTAFVRPPAYPLFIAVMHLAHIPLRLGIELLQAAGYLAVVTGLRKAAVPRAACLICYAAMILHPGSYQLNSVTMADNFYAAVLPLALGGLLLTLFTANSWHAAWTGIALAVLWNTREESILIPPMIAVFLLLALARRRQATPAWMPALRFWLKPAGVLLGMLFLLNLAVNAANYRTFRSFSKSELTEPNFRAAFKSLLRIQPERHHRFVSVSSDALQKAYSISPTFARLKPQLDGDLGHNFKVPAISALGLEEIGAPWFLWALRGTASTQGVHDNADAARRFYGDVAHEIDRACDEGRVPCRFVLSSLLDPGALAHIRDMPESFPRIAALFALPYRTMEGRDDDILTQSQRALYDEMTYRRPAPTLGSSTALENFIGRYHRFLVMGLALAGFAAALTIAWRFRQVRASDPLNTALILLGTTIFLRVLFFTFLDATWWIGGYDRYLFPVLPLTSCFFILLIYQAFDLRRRATPANISSS